MCTLFQRTEAAANQYAGLIVERELTNCALLIAMIKDFGMRFFDFRQFFNLRVG